MRLPVRTLVVVIFTAAATSLAGQQVFRASVDVVSLNVSVTQGNRPVEGLTTADFAVADNGVPQTIVDVSRDEVPIDLTMIADMTPGAFQQSSIVAGVNLVRQNLRPTDRLRVITFDLSIIQTGAFASPNDVAPLGMPAEVLDPIGGRAPSRCFDALVLGLSSVPVPDRRQLVIFFSGGRDTLSFLDEAAALDAAKRSTAAVVFVRSIVNPAPRPTAEDLELGRTPRALPPNPHTVRAGFFSDVADVTGGSSVTVESGEILRVNERGGIQAARGRLGDPGFGREFLRALDVFRNSYVVRYRLGGVPRAGWHDVRVTVPRGRVDIRTRKGWQG
jgi:hypothetical protein